MPKFPSSATSSCSIGRVHFVYLLAECVFCAPTTIHCSQSFDRFIDTNDFVHMRPLSFTRALTHTRSTHTDYRCPLLSVTPIRKFPIDECNNFLSNSYSSVFSLNLFYAARPYCIISIGTEKGMGTAAWKEKQTKHLSAVSHFYAFGWFKSHFYRTVLSHTTETPSSGAVQQQLQ